MVETALRHASIGVRCELCEVQVFLGAHPKRSSLESSRVKICNFIRKGRKTRKIRAFESSKNDIARRAYMVTILWTGSDKFGQVWTSQNRCEVLFFFNRESHAVQIWPTPRPACSFLTVPCSKLYDPPKWWKQRFVTLQLA